MIAAALAPREHSGLSRARAHLPSRARLDAAWRSLTRVRAESIAADLALRVSGEGVSATAVDGTPMIGDASVEDALASARAVDLIVGPRDHLELLFDVPAAPLAEVEGMIESEIALQTPFGSGEARWVWEAHERPEGKGWQIRAAVMLAELVDPALALADLAGTRISALRCEREDGSVLSARPGWAVGLSTARGWIPAGIRSQAAALGLAAACAGGLLTGQAVQRADLAAEASAARADTAALRASLATDRTLDAADRVSAARLVLPGRLAQDLPDDVWLERLSADADGFSLTGQAPSATDVVDRLAAIGGLSDIRFAAPVTRDTAQAMERFRIDGAFGSRR